MKKRLLSFALVITSLLIMSCGEKEKDSSTITSDEVAQEAVYFNGSSTLSPVITEIASDFNEEFGSWDKVDPTFSEEPISIYVASGGSGQGVTTLVDGTTSFGMLARELKEEEVQKIKEPQEYLVGIDALAISVPVDSPLLTMSDDLTTEQIVQIFSGEHQTWKEVDDSLPADEIVVVTRDIGGGAHEVFQKNIMDDVDVSVDAIQEPSMGGLVEKVSSNKNAIGYASYGVANQNEGKIIKLKIDGIECTEENIVSGAYILQRPLLLVSSGEPTDQQKAFLEVVLGEKGQSIVEKQGFIKPSNEK